VKVNLAVIRSAEFWTSDLSTHPCGIQKEISLKYSNKREM
jgi:hypothetical protein